MRQDVLVIVLHLLDTSLLQLRLCLYYIICVCYNVSMSSLFFILSYFVVVSFVEFHVFGGIQIRAKQPIWE